MTQEEKQLLLKDLCARLPYGVKVLYWHPKSGGAERRIGELVNVDLRLNCAQLLFRIDEYYFEADSVGTSKPYLRPMSSMTEEEIDEYRNLSDEVIGSYGAYHHEFIAHCVRLGIKPDNQHECVDHFLNMEAIDWLNAHHFDYRGLIEKGLALEAPEGMYKTE